MSRYYWWDKETDKVEETNVTNWAKSYEVILDRIVKQDQIGPYFVSTVFLGLNHAFGEGPPLIFETMVFSNQDYGNALYEERYSTPSDAREGHARAVAEYSKLKE